MRGLSACMRCGSLELRSRKASEGAIGVAFFDESVCRECGWQGMPLEFEDEAAWRAFVQARKSEPWDEGPPGTIAACRECGSRGLRLEGAAARCSKCGHAGPPAFFDREDAWRQFAQSRRNASGEGGEAG
jgi:transcription initiation factor TFIIIB Brf1 subunit/transcription initiation factor TFIIB